MVALTLQRLSLAQMAGAAHKEIGGQQPSEAALWVTGLGLQLGQTPTAVAAVAHIPCSAMAAMAALAEVTAQMPRVTEPGVVALVVQP